MQSTSRVAREDVGSAVGRCARASSRCSSSARRTGIRGAFAAADRLDVTAHARRGIWASATARTSASARRSCGSCWGRRSRRWPARARDSSSPASRAGRRRGAASSAWRCAGERPTASPSSPASAPPSCSRWRDFTPDCADAVVYLSGSLVSGHANPWSDIDLFAVTDREPVGSTSCAPARTSSSRTSSPTAAPTTSSGLPRRSRELADRLASYELGSGISIPGASFLQIEKIFIHRVRVGVPLCNPDGFAELQALYDFERFAAFLTEEAMRHLDSELEDLVGMRKGGDRDSALWVARQTVEVAVEAWLHARGNTDPVHKWQVRYLAALGDGERETRRARGLLAPRDAGRGGRPARRRRRAGTHTSKRSSRSPTASRRGCRDDASAGLRRVRGRGGPTGGLAPPARLPWPGAPAANAWALASDGGAVLVDTGLRRPGSFGRLRAGLRAAGFELEDVRLVACTHAHGDHIGPGRACRRGRRVRAVAAPRAPSRPRARSPTRGGDRAPARDGSALRRTGGPRSRCSPSRSARRTSASPATRGPTGCSRDGVSIETDVGRWQVVETPGHAPSHVCLFEPQAGLLLSGDHVLERPSLGLDHGWTPDPGGRAAALARSRRGARRADAACRATARRSSRSTRASPRRAPWCTSASTPSARRSAPARARCSGSPSARMRTSSARAGWLDVRRGAVPARAPRTARRGPAR